VAVMVAARIRARSPAITPAVTIAPIVKGRCAVAHDEARRAALAGVVAGGAGDRRAARRAGQPTDERPGTTITVPGNARAEQRAERATDHRAGAGIARRLKRWGLHISSASARH